MNNQWQKRIASKYSCPSGNQVRVRRCSPIIGLKANRFLPILKRIKGTAEEQLTAITALSDGELEQLTAFAEIVLADAVVDPPLTLKPQEGILSPSDLPMEDFWIVFLYVSSGCPEIPVKTKEGETTVEEVASFLTDEGSGAGANTDREIIQ